MIKSLHNIFFVGGTVPREVPSYIVRAADKRLLSRLQHGAYCYVLDTSQVGKSSLIVRTEAELAADGASVAVVDLTSLGRPNEQEVWYDLLLRSIAKGLDIEAELKDFGAQNKDLTPLPRWLKFLRQVVLVKRRNQVFLFFDEINYVRSLPFSTDEFFAGIRFCYNERARDSEMQRLTFCFLGTATPDSLVQDPYTTPFNIGERVDLTDFTQKEAAPLAEFLGKDGNKRLQRILHWTGGHPYLTQNLCRAVAELESEHREGDVDDLCRQLFFDPGARESEPNLMGVAQILAGTGEDHASVLDLYNDVLSPWRRVFDDPLDPVTAQLQLTGLVRSEQSRLVVRNKIYRRVFNRKWAKEQYFPRDIQRRNAAIARGRRQVWGVASAMTVLILVALWAVIQVGQQARDREHLRRGRYGQDMLAAHRAWELGEIDRVQELLNEYNPSHDPTKKQTQKRSVYRLDNSQEDIRGFEWHLLKHLSQSDEVTPRSLARLTEEESPGQVKAVAYAPNGRLLAFAGSTGRILLWSTDGSGKLSLLPDSQLRDIGVMGLAFSPDSRYLAVAGGSGLNTPHDRYKMYKGGVELWDVTIPSHPKRLDYEVKSDTEKQEHRQSVNCVAFSPDGRYLATGGEDHMVEVWDIADHRLHLRFKKRVHELGVNGVAFSHDGRSLAAVSGSGVLRLWEMPSGKPIYNGEDNPYQDDSSGLMSVCFSPDDRSLLLGSRDGFILIKRFDLPSLKFSKSIPYLQGHKGSVYSLQFSQDGKLLASAGSDRTVRVWDFKNRSELALLRGHKTEVRSVAFSREGQTLASGSDDKTVKLWKAPNLHRTPPVNESKVTELRPPSSPPSRPPAVLAIALSPTDQHIAVAYADGKIHLWRTNSVNGLKPEVTFSSPPWQAYTIAFSPDGKQMASAGQDGQIRLWDISTHRFVKLLHSQPIPATYNSKAAPVPSDRGVQCIAFSPSRDRAWLATGGQDRVVRLFDVRTRNLIGSIPKEAHDGWVRSIAFSPDGRMLATGSSDRTVRLWRIEVRPTPIGSTPTRSAIGAKAQVVSLRLLLELDGPEEGTSSHAGQVHVVTFSRDGKLLATAGRDQTIRLWDVASGKLFVPNSEGENGILSGHSAQVNSLSFSPDGKTLASGSQDNTIKLWNLPTFREVANLTTHRRGVTSVAFSPHRKLLVTGSYDGTVHLWRAD